jgi:hypothetical protein
MMLLTLYLLLLTACLLHAAGEKATVWSFNFFFYNKKMKRMVYLSCRAASKLSVEKEVSRGAMHRSQPALTASNCLPMLAVLAAMPWHLQATCKPPASACYVLHASTGVSPLPPALSPEP